jgi:hypothetical protein
MIDPMNRFLKSVRPPLVLIGYTTPRVAIAGCCIVPEGTERVAARQSIRVLTFGRHDTGSVV